MERQGVGKLRILKKWMKETDFINGVVYAVPIILILFVCLYHLGDKQTIIITGDEYGYWAAGSYFAGLDWSEVTSINSYYGYGYGIILSFILRLTSSQIVAYQVAIVINAFFLCIIYLIAFQIIKELTYTEKIPNIIQVIIAFTVTMYTDNIYYTQYTLSETLIAVLYWLTLYLFVLMQKKVTFLRSVLFFIVLAYSFSVHMRTIGVLIVSVIMWLYIIWKQNKKIVRFVVLILLVFAVTLFLVVGIKAFYKQEYYSKIAGIQSDVNELSGQLGKIRYFLSLEGMYSFFNAFLGKVFYAITSSFLLVGTTVILFIERVKNCFSELKVKKKLIIDDRTLFLIYVLFSCISMMGICSLYMISYNQQFDLLTYGRYFSYTISPLIMVAIVFLYKKSFQKKIKILLWTSFFYLAIAIWINYIQDYKLLNSKTFIHNVFVASVMRFDYAENSLLILSLSAVLISGIFMFLISKQEKTGKNLLFAVAAGVLVTCWISCGQYVYKNGCLSWSILEQKSELNLCEYIQNNEIEDKLYYCYSENVLKVDILQFLLKENTVHCIRDLEEFEQLDIEGYLLTPAKTNYAETLLEQDYTLLAESMNLKLWSKFE